MFRLSPLSSTAYPLYSSHSMARWQPRALGPGRGDFLSSRCGCEEIPLLKPYSYGTTTIELSMDCFKYYRIDGSIIQLPMYYMNNNYQQWKNVLSNFKQRIGLREN